MFLHRNTGIACRKAQNHGIRISKTDAMLPRMSIRQCRALAAIADHGSFGGAARALSIAQSAVSMQIAALEQSLGTELFDRSHRPPRLTDAGQAALVHARSVVREHDAMIAAASGSPEIGTVRIGVIPTVLSTLLPAALIALRADPASPRLTVISALSGQLVRSVDEGALDAAVVHRPESMPPGTDWHPIARQEIVVLAPASAPEPDLPALFAAHAYIRFNRQAWVAPLIEQRLASLGLKPETGAEIESIEAIRMLVGLGFGVSAIPATGPEADPGLRTLPFGDPPLFRQIGLLMRRPLSAGPRGARLAAAFAGSEA